ncbi:hypothetical protein L9F63_005913, partial [Diploptera punctata]
IITMRLILEKKLVSSYGIYKTINQMNLEFLPRTSNFFNTQLQWKDIIPIVSCFHNSIFFIMPLIFQFYDQSHIKFFLNLLKFVMNFWMSETNQQNFFLFLIVAS